MTPTETTDLVKVESMNAVTVFTGGGMNAVLDSIEAEVRAIPLDPSTTTGRDEIRSVAYKVARTKTALDAAGKKLTEEWRKQTTLVNAERKKATERLDVLADDVRRPLTEFENKEKTRCAAHEDALAEMSGMLMMLQEHPEMAASLLQEHLLDFSELHKGREWEEFADRAKRIRGEINVYLINRIEGRKKYEADQAELTRLRQEEEERRQRERDERLKAEAAETARREAERLAAAIAEAERKRVEAAAEEERQRVAAEAEMVRLDHERQQREAEGKRQVEERARLDAERRAKEAEDARVAAALKAEEDRIAAEKKAADEKRAAEEKAAVDLKAAQEKAKRDREAAIKRERERVEQERQAAETERLKREADEANKARIRGEILADIKGSFVASLREWDEDYCSVIADAILAGQIRNLRVTY